MGSTCAWWRQRWTVWPLLPTSSCEVHSIPAPASLCFPPLFKLQAIEITDDGGYRTNAWCEWGDEWLWVELFHSDLQLGRITAQVLGEAWFFPEKWGAGGCNSDFTSFFTASPSRHCQEGTRWQLWGSWGCCLCRLSWWGLQNPSCETGYSARAQENLCPRL